MATEKNLSNLVINKVESQDVYDYMKNNNLINADELYLVPGSDETTGAAGAELGLVKSGGDVTISDGVITVNDDSHNHVIGNVDGLQDALNKKVDIVSGKGLSTNDLTAALKANYDAAYTHSQQAHAPSTAEKNVIVGVQKNGSDVAVDSSTRKVNITVPTKTSELTNDSNFATTTALDNKVDKVSGKVLSSNDYTDAEKTKLSGVAEGANKTVVDTALSSSSTNPVQNKVVQSALTTMQSSVDGKVPSTRTVNGKALSADINLSASDVGALPNTTTIPSVDGLASETYVDSKVADAVASVPGSTNVGITLSASAWSDGVQTVTVSGLTAEKNGIIGPAQNISEEQQTAMGDAMLYVVSQASNSLTIGCHGDVPTVDLQAVVILLP